MFYSPLTTEDTLDPFSPDLSTDVDVDVVSDQAWFNITAFNSQEAPVRTVSKNYLNSEVVSNCIFTNSPAPIVPEPWELTAYIKVNANQSWLSSSTSN